MLSQSPCPSRPCSTYQRPGSSPPNAPRCLLILPAPSQHHFSTAVQTWGPGFPVKGEVCQEGSGNKGFLGLIRESRRLRWSLASQVVVTM